MTVTRDDDFPPEIAALFQVFNTAAEGHEAVHVIEAASNFLVAAIVNSSMSHGRNFAIGMAERIGTRLSTHVATQWDRESQPSDIRVPLRGN